MKTRRDSPRARVTDFSSATHVLWWLTSVWESIIQNYLQNCFILACGLRWVCAAALHNKLINDDAGSKNLFRTCFNFPYILFIVVAACVFLTLHLTWLIYNLMRVVKEYGVCGWEWEKHFRVMINAKHGALKRAFNEYCTPSILKCPYCNYTL